MSEPNKDDKTLYILFRFETKREEEVFVREMSRSRKVKYNKDELIRTRQSCYLDYCWKQHTRVGWKKYDADSESYNYKIQLNTTLDRDNIDTRYKPHNITSINQNRCDYCQTDSVVRSYDVAWTFVNESQQELFASFLEKKMWDRVIRNPGKGRVYCLTSHPIEEHELTISCGGLWNLAYVKEFNKYIHENFVMKNLRRCHVLLEQVVHPHPDCNDDDDDDDQSESDSDE